MILKMNRSIVGIATTFAILCSASVASATLTTFAAYSGNVGVSVDGGGSYQSTLPNGLTADIPAGSTIVAAYLYTSTFNDLSGAGGTLNGNAVSYTALPINADSTTLQAGRADVTSIVKGVVNGSGPAAGGVYNFAVTEASSGQDGEVLVTVYSNPLLPTQSIGILDGSSASGGDTSSINFSSNPSTSTVLLSVGDGFSYDQGGVTDQRSTITVDGSTLTTAAGNCDDSQDGYCTNGDLITAGTLGLNANGSVDTSYSDPFTPIGETDINADHELYNISSLINPAAGNTITLTTYNSSYDDNIFLEVFDATGLAGFNAPPPPPPNGNTPEPGTLSLLGLGLSSLGVIQRKFRNRRSN